jgi:hypothetical protein
MSNPRRYFLRELLAVGTPQAAADTLLKLNYVAFDVDVTPATLFAGQQKN